MRTREMYAHSSYTKVRFRSLSRPIITHFAYLYRISDTDAVLEGAITHSSSSCTSNNFINPVIIWPRCASFEPSYFIQ